MLQKTIVEHLNEEIDALQDRINLIQEQCNHPLVVRQTEHKADTGNWDRGQDSYWTTHVCPLCELRWDTDQDWERTGDGRGTPKKKETIE